MKATQNWLQCMIVLAGAMTVLAQPPFEGEARAQREARSFRPAVWLGVNLGPVPQALAVHLGLDEPEPGIGLVVHNLVIGGPADRGGLLRYDVIVEVDGKKVLRELAAFVQDTQHYKVGDKLPLTVIRRGQRQKVEVTLGEPVPQEKVKYKYPRGRHALLRERRISGVQIYEKGPRGWQQRSPIKGKPEHILEGLPEGLRKQVKKHLAFDPELDVPFTIRQPRRGHVIQIDRNQEGHITVSRIEEQDSDEEKVVESKTYSNGAELAAEDPAAFRVYAGASLAARQIAPGRDPADRRRLWSQEQQMRSKFRDHWRSGAERRRQQRRARPQIRFDVDEQGRIRVELDRGDEVMILNFRDEEEFRKMSPRLFNRYKKMYE